MVRGKRKFKNKKVILQYTPEGELVEVYKSISLASDYSRINVGLISQSCRKMIKLAGGYRWEYGNSQEIFITH